jgi:hypothetical protein
VRRDFQNFAGDENQACRAPSGRLVQGEDRPHLHLFMRTEQGLPAILNVPDRDGITGATQGLSTRRSPGLRRMDSIVRFDRPDQDEHP